MNTFLPWNQAARAVSSSRIISKLALSLLFCLSLCLGLQDLHGQVFGVSDLDFNGNNGVSSPTSLMFGPDGRLYVQSRLGEVDIYTIQRNGKDDYQVIASENITSVSTIPNHNDDGTAASANRQATGLTVAGTASNPVIYVTSSDSRIGGPSGDQGLDTNSGVITRLSWNGSSWVAVDIVRGLSRSEENHATNGLEFASVNGTDYLIVCSGGHANAGGPSDNFAWVTEYALSAAVLSVNLTQLEALPILTDASSGRQYIYDIPTLDDPTRANANGIIDPGQSGYDGIDVNDPWGGNDGLNQAMIVPGGPVQIFSPGYRNTYDLVLTENGRVYVTDNGANGGWGGLPKNEGMDGTVTNDYNIDNPTDKNELGSTGQHPTADGESVNNADHLHLATINRTGPNTNGTFANAVSIENYNFGAFYGGHPTPIRANPAGAGLFTNPEVNNYNPATSVFRTLIYDPSNPGPGFTDDPNIALPANWPPVPVSMADPIEGDWRGPGINNPDGPNDLLVTTWGTNTNGIDEYTASNFGGAMKGDLIAGKNGGVLRRVQLNADGSLDQLTGTWQSNLGGNILGITCNSDSDPFPGTIWAANFSNNEIKVLEPDDLIEVTCILPGEPGYSPTDDNDSDGYTNEDEIQSKQLTEAGVPETDEEVTCNPGNQPNDFDQALGGTLVSDFNDPDDDGDGIPDASDPFQFGTLGSSDDAFDLPVFNELFSDNPQLFGYLGLGFTGMMNNGDTGPNWTSWLDRRFDPTDANTNDILGGAVGAMTMQMTAGTALGAANNQDKAFQYGVKVDQSIGSFTVTGRMLNFTSDLQLYNSQSPAAGEIGFFIGDGTQSNYIKFVLTQNGLTALQEINDNPQSPVSLTLATGDRPNSNIELLFSVNAVTGLVTLQYVKDGGILETLGTITAQGAVLNAIQTSTPLAVGLIGSSNTPGDEIEGTWDYLNVESTLPFVEAELPDVGALINDPNQTINLDDYFGDDAGDGNLTYSVVSNTNGAIGAVVNGNTLTLSFPSTEETGAITVRATDGSSQFVEQTFTVTVNDEPVPILRIRANGATIAATDGPNPDWLGGLPGGAQSGTFNGITYAVNGGNLSTHNITGRDASVPAYVPQALFANERWDPSAGDEMEWTFTLPNGNYFVRLYMGNGFAGTSAPGARVFDISLEGQLVQNDLDLAATFGHQTGGMIEYQVPLTDGTLNLLFERVVENPLINGIEILAAGGQVVPPIMVSVPDQSNLEGDEGINLAVVPTGGEPNENFNFAVQNLPPGLQIEETTGLIFGDIAAGAAANSPYSSSVTVSQPFGSNPNAEATANFTWTVTPPVGNATWNDQTDDENYTGRHECSFVQAGDKFYLFGGRESPTTLDVYDYQNKTWSPIPNSAPEDFNHFQAVEYQGLIWVIGAFRTNPGQEIPADFVWAYNPATDEWIQGPAVPAGRKRGSAGLVLYNDKFYVTAGNTMGHNGGYVPWFDEFDPATGTWTQLPDAPHARDHFHAAVIGDKMYVAGGRLSGGPGGTFAPLVAEVDVYDFNTGTWSTLPADIPTPRAAPAVAVFQDELYVMGGEVGVDLQGNTIDAALNTTEAYNPQTGTWSTKPSLLNQRHGTQAIVSGNGIHVAAGSPNKGGGNIKQMEYFGTDNPTGTPSSASQLQTPVSVGINANSTASITATAAGGNTGIIITSAQITGPDAAMFSLDTPVDFALLAPGTSLDLTVGFNGTENGKTATLEIDYGNASTATITLNSAVLVPGSVLYRVNNGGPLTVTNDVDPTDWSGDQATAGSGTANGTAATGTPSPYIDLAAPALDLTYGPPAATVLTNTTGYPDALFLTERYSTAANPNNMNWAFPVDNGDYTVNLLLAESFFTASGARIFDVEIEGTLVLDDLDLFAAYGNNVAAVETFQATVTDGVLDINFLKGSANNPAIKGIEILGGGSPPTNAAPIVTNPGGQFGVEGDNVTLQIAASDIDPCTGLTYTATGLPPSLTIDETTGLISGTLAAGSGSGTAGAFIESGGIVVIEMESVETLPGSWEDASTYSTTFSPNVNNPTGAAGGDFIIWQGGQSLGNPGNGLLTYPVEITTPGVYQFQWRNQVGNGTNTTEHNDTWLKIEADAFYGQKGGGSIVCPKGLNGAENDCIGGAPEGAGAGGWFKVYSSGANNWSWSSNTSDNDAHQIFARFDAPGVYNILVSARSSSHAIDRMVLAKTDYSGNPQSLALSESPRSQGGMAGAAANSPYNVTVTVTDGCDPALSTDVNFVWNVSEIMGTNPEATVKVNSGAALGASTFGNNSFQIENSGDVDIVNVTINTATGFMMDVVFDPVGTAGDNAAKCLTTGTAGNTAAEVGITVPANGGSDAADCVSVFAQPHNGVDNDEGYDELTLDFTDFNPGELFAFGVDMDPTTIKGDLSAGDAGSISGFELIGATVTVQFANGALLTTSLFDEGSVGGSDAIVNQTANDLNPPGINVGGSIANQLVSDANQIISIVGGPANGTVTLLQVDGRLYIDPGNPNVGYDIDPFEANEAMTKVLYTVGLDASGNGSIPVTLLQTAGGGGTPDGGLNHLIAVATSPGGENSVASNVIVLEYDPNAPTEADLTLTVLSEGRGTNNTNHSGQHTVECYTLNDLETPAYTFTPTADANGQMSVSGIASGTYKVLVKRVGFLQKVQELTFTTGTETADFGMMLAGNLNDDNVVNILDFSTLAGQFNQSGQISDFNGDGVTNILDFSLLAGNFNKSGDALATGN